MGQSLVKKIQALMTWCRASINCVMGNCPYQSSALSLVCRSSLIRDLDKFAKKAAPGSIIIFYYAGHGLVHSNGDHCLMTKEWDSTWPDSDDAAIAAAGYPIEQVLQPMLNAAPGCRMIALLDTCRQLTSTTRGDGLSASSMRAAALHLKQNSCSETLVCHACRFGSTAADLSSGGNATNGLYTSQLLQVITGRPPLRMQPFPTNCDLTRHQFKAIHWLPYSVLLISC